MPNLDFVAQYNKDTQILNFEFALEGIAPEKVPPEFNENMENISLIDKKMLLLRLAKILYESAQAINHTDEKL